MQRVEPFLDLSLPITDEQPKLLENSDHDRNGAKYKKEYKRSSFMASKNKGKKWSSNDALDEKDEITDPKENNLSKHQSKKQKKILKKGKVNELISVIKFWRRLFSCIF